MTLSYINSRTINHEVIYSYILFICLHFYQISKKNNLSNTICIFLTILYFHLVQFIYDYIIYKLKRYKSHSDLYLFNPYNTFIHSFNYSYFQKKYSFFLKIAVNFRKKIILASPFYFFIRTFMIFYDCIF